MEEAVDAGTLLRGQWLEVLHGVRRARDVSVQENVLFTAVTDAKDCHDRIVKDTNGHGQQKSLAFSVAGLKEMLRVPGGNMRWTSTKNLFVDPMTKKMPSDKLLAVLYRGTWSIEYNKEVCFDVFETSRMKIAGARRRILNLRSRVRM